MPLIRIDRLTKSYGGVQALQAVSLDIAAGEVHALCGENGAGKSTFIKVLTGAVAPDDGEIAVNGQQLRPGSIHAAEAAGIAVVHQESTAFPDLNAVDNIFVGRELTRCGGWLLDRPAMRRRTHEILDWLGESLDTRRAIGELPLAQRQIVALARAVSRDCRLLVMDEPTASLSHRETEMLLKRIRQLKETGVAVLYVSHRLDEIFEIADRVTVLRDGRHVGTCPTAELAADELIQMMVGRELDELTRRHSRSAPPGPVVLEVRDLSSPPTFDGISLSVRAGEIVGLAGLVGAGRSEVARALFGIDRPRSGTVLVSGKRVAPGSVSVALAAGLALVPEDRQHEGLVLPMSVRENFSLAMLHTLRRGGLLSSRKERSLVEEQMRSLQIKAAGIGVPAQSLSGGNQQKLVLGKWLASRPKVLILDEPTRGIDVGAKSQVHRLIRELAEQGLATLLISSELPELLTLCDRILVMRQGQLVGDLAGNTATQEQVLALALPDAAAEPTR